MAVEGPFEARFPREIVAYAVWTYHRFFLCTADSKDLLAERKVMVSREAVYLWVNRFDRHCANCIRRGRQKPNDRWQGYEVVITIGGKKLWFWEFIDADDDVLDIFVQARRDSVSAKLFFSTLVRRFGQP